MNVFLANIFMQKFTVNLQVANVIPKANVTNKPKRVLKMKFFGDFTSPPVQDLSDYVQTLEKVSFIVQHPPLKQITNTVCD
jgi:hypothetical protein